MAVYGWVVIGISSYRVVFDLSSDEYEPALVWPALGVLLVLTAWASRDAIRTFRRPRGRD